MSAEGMVAEDCKTCARRSECGKAFTPQVDWGECGHCDGCMSYERKAEGGGEWA